MVQVRLYTPIKKIDVYKTQKKSEILDQKWNLLNSIMKLTEDKSDDLNKNNLVYTIIFSVVTISSLVLGMYILF
jgi:hypothetical protein